MNNNVLIPPEILQLLLQHLLQSNQQLLQSNQQLLQSNQQLLQNNQQLQEHSQLQSRNPPALSGMSPSALEQYRRSNFSTSSKRHVKMNWEPILGAALIGGATYALSEKEKKTNALDASMSFLKLLA